MCYSSLERNDLTIHRVFMATTAAEWRAILQWLSEEYKKYTTMNDFNKAAWRNRPYVGVFVLQCTFLNTIPGGSITQCECVQEHLLIVKDVMLDCLNSLLYRDVLPSVNMTTPVAHLVKGLKHILTNLHLSDTKWLTVHSGYTYVLSVCVFPGNRSHNLCTANTMLYHWATGTQQMA